MGRLNMDFSNFTIEKKVNPAKLEDKPKNKKQVSTKVKYTSPVHSSIRRTSKGADYTLFPKVWQTCEKCEEGTLHIISKKTAKIRCTVCNFTYKFEVV